MKSSNVQGTNVSPDKKYQEVCFHHSPHQVVLSREDNSLHENLHNARMNMVECNRESRNNRRTLGFLNSIRCKNKVIFGALLVVVFFVFASGVAFQNGSYAQGHRIIGYLSKRFTSFFNRRTGPMNVVFIVADDLGWNDIGYKNKNLVTPTLDKLARGGVILNQSYVQSTCSPSRAAMLTGRYPHRMGLQYRTITINQAKFIPLEMPTMAEELKARGYATHAVGKWHVGHCNWKYTPTSRGFDSHSGFLLASEDYFTHIAHKVYDFWHNTNPDLNSKGVYSTDIFAAKADDVIRQHADTRTEPLFLYLAFQSIHGPLNQPPEMYKSPKIQQVRKTRLIVHDMILALDAAITKLVHALEDTGMMENTLIVFTSDNGGALDSWADNAPLRGGKFSQWEGGTRTITFINGPMVDSPGRVFEGLFHAVDWKPTILAAVDKQRYEIDPNAKRIPQTNTDGLNQWDGLVENNPGVFRKEIIYTLDEVDGTYVYRFGDFKLMEGSPVCTPYQKQMTENHGPNPSCWYDSYTNRRHSNCSYQNRDIMLFNVMKDPEERFDIAEERPDVVDALKRRMDQLKKDVVPNQSNDAVDIKKYIQNDILYPGWCQ